MLHAVPTKPSALRLHAYVVAETLVAMVTLALCAVAVFLFVSGSQIFTANRERSGVRITRTVGDSSTQVSGSFVTRSECTHVDVLTSQDDGTPVVYLTEKDDDACSQYTNPRPYTFTASFEGQITQPIAVYMDGDQIATIEN